MFSLQKQSAKLEFAGGSDRRSEGSTPASKPAAKPQQSGGYSDPSDDFIF